MQDCAIPAVFQDAALDESLMPKRIAAAEIADGMKLAEPVLNRQGQVLLAAGTDLAVKHKMMFKTWGIAQIVIEGGDDGGAGPGGRGGLTKEVLNLALARLNRRWLWKPRNALEKEMYLVAVRRAAELAVKANKE